MSDEIHQAITSKYGSVARSSLSSSDSGVNAVAISFGYSPEELSSIPAEANMGLSCGNPVVMASIRPGEVVVDLGCGGGMDVFLTSKMVGESGQVIGIDMTPDMIERAQANAAAGMYRNVRFCLATIDHLPLEDASVDCVLSNCVLNLAPDKPAVFREIVRVLKPGGRLAVSDIALKAELPPEIARSMAAYVGCIAGAIPIEEYRNQLLHAGFADVEIVDSGADLNAYAKVENQSGCCSPAMQSQPTNILPIANCCSSEVHASTEQSVHEQGVHAELRELLSHFDVNQAAASVKVFAVKPV